MKSCIYEGWVRHRRFRPRPHAFTYSIFLMFLDLSELDEVFEKRWLWSSRRLAPARFRRTDHMGPAHQPLAESVADLVQERTQWRPDGPIRLLTHLRYFGYCFNPVSFYYCYDKTDRHLSAIVAEVNNTPWGERHCYVLSEESNSGRGSHKQYTFPKRFHVSPFMDMDLVYHWKLSTPASGLSVHMQNLEAGELLFDATMSLSRREISTRSLNRTLIRYPLMTVQVVAAIYWNALRLWLKGIPSYAHPAPQGFQPRSLSSQKAASEKIR